jgi:serine/threonine-protein kinase
MMLMSFQAGEQLLHYRLIRQIGEGGMGVVFEAEDERLGRTVAIKRLRASFSEDPGLRERFLREARAASAVDHPNLCTVYAVEEAPDGSLLLVMAFYRGQTLAELVKQGPLDHATIRNLGGQVAAGLHAAHLRGIVHRDVKPANIFLLHPATVKILDFGLSRGAHLQQLTAQHQVMGTLAYMPPEQLAGSDVDHRADVWALGAVLYEMATGHSPFRKPTPSATMAAISRADYLPLHKARPDLPPSLHDTVARALRLSPQDRHASAADMLALLHGEAETAWDVAVTRRPDPQETTVAFAAWAGDRSVGTQPTAHTTSKQATAHKSVFSPEKAGLAIAVLPMQNVSSDTENEFFCDGLTDELISSLGTMAGLRVVSRTSVFSLKGKRHTVPEIGKMLHVQAVLEGSVRRSGTRTRVSMQLTEAEEGVQVWSARFDRAATDLFELQDELAASVLSALQAKLAPDLQQAERQARNPMQTSAYETYLKGRYHWERRTITDVQLAGRYFEQALEQDPTSAAVHAGLADFYALQGTLGMMDPHEAWHNARTLALQAITLDPELAEGHIALSNVLQFYDWNWSGAREHIDKALALRPQRGESYYISVANLMMQGLLEEALVQARLGLNYDPLAVPLLGAEAMLRLYLGDHETAQLLAESALKSAPQNAELYYSLALAQARSGRADEAVATLERGLQASGMPVLKGWLAEAYVQNGEPEKARQVLAELLAMADQGTAIHVALAIAAAAVEEPELALDWLHRAAEMRDVFVVYLTIFPSLKPLHDHPRYHGLLARMRLKHPSTHRSAR